MLRGVHGGWSTKSGLPSTLRLFRALLASGKWKNWRRYSSRPIFSLALLRHYSFLRYSSRSVPFRFVRSPCLSLSLSFSMCAIRYYYNSFARSLTSTTCSHLCNICNIPLIHHKYHSRVSFFVILNAITVYVYNYIFFCSYVLYIYSITREYYLSFGKIGSI